MAIKGFLLLAAAGLLARALAHGRHRRSQPDPLPVLPSPPPAAGRNDDLLSPGSGDGPIPA
jgi:hypothetical protein